MNLEKKIISLGLSSEGGVYRRLPLFTLSSAAHGYCTLIQKSAGVSYGQVGALGTKHGWQTYYGMDRIVRRISNQLRHDRHWAVTTRSEAKKICQDFVHEMNELTALITANPRRFLRFAIRRYPWYMAGIGIYNFYWRYLEFADTSMAPFPRRGLKQLGIERNKMADIYPHFEQAFSKAVKIFAKEIACTPKHLLMMTRTELAQTIAHSRLAVYKVELGNRCRGFVYLCTGLHETVSTNRKEIGRMKKYSRSSFHQKPHQELKGMSVQPGRVTGRVIRNLKRRSWPRNPVYVVSNTHPSEIPYLKKVSAIVTDEGGGILSHAAIVSRELRIPCVIGTKIATKVLKDGEMVEVDAKKGIIKKK